MQADLNSLHVFAEYLLGLILISYLCSVHCQVCAHQCTPMHLAPPLPPQDAPLPGVGGLLQSCWTWGNGVIDNVVGTLSDTFMASPIAPYNVQRTPVENSMRGALALVCLALLKSMLSVGG